MTIFFSNFGFMFLICKAIKRFMGNVLYPKKARWKGLLMLFEWLRHEMRILYHEIQLIVLSSNPDREASVTFPCCPRCVTTGQVSERLSDMEAHRSRIPQTELSQ